MAASSANDETLAAYEHNLAAYIAKSPKSATPVIRDWLGSVLAYINTDARILEVGSGTGRDADYIESRGYVVERSDAAMAFIEYLQAQGHSVRRINLLTDSLGGPYELILADAVFLHFDAVEFAHILRKCREALGPSGYLAFTLKEGDGEAWSSDKLDEPRYFHYWRIPEVAKLLDETGYEIIDQGSFAGAFDGATRIEFCVRPRITTV
jgi:SAM-dependent methyltransferase